MDCEGVEKMRQRAVICVVNEEHALEVGSPIIYSNNPLSNEISVHGGSWDDYWYKPPIAKKPDLYNQMSYDLIVRGQKFT